jgi:hypothetical protein
MSENLNHFVIEDGEIKGIKNSYESNDSSDHEEPLQATTETPSAESLAALAMGLNEQLEPLAKSLGESAKEKFKEGDSDAIEKSRRSFNIKGRGIIRKSNIENNQLEQMAAILSTRVLPGNTNTHNGEEFFEGYKMELGISLVDKDGNQMPEEEKALYIKQWLLTTIHDQHNDVATEVTNSCNSSLLGNNNTARLQLKQYNPEENIEEKEEENEREEENEKEIKEDAELPLSDDCYGIDEMIADMETDKEKPGWKISKNTRLLILSIMLCGSSAFYLYSNPKMIESLEKNIELLEAHNSKQQAIHKEKKQNFEKLLNNPFRSQQ